MVRIWWHSSFITIVVKKFWFNNGGRRERIRIRSWFAVIVSGVNGVLEWSW